MHRDIKPDNILWREGRTASAPPEAIFGDWGGATFAQIGQPLSGVGLCGTSGYAAPESLRKNSSYECGVDVFSLGVTWYEAVAADFLFAVWPKRGDDMDALRQQADDRATAGISALPDAWASKIWDTPCGRKSKPGNHRPSDATVRDILSRMCEVDPEHRPSAAKLVQETEVSRFLPG